jgi:hypothetical protein
MLLLNVIIIIIRAVQQAHATVCTSEARLEKAQTRHFPGRFGTVITGLNEHLPEPAGRGRRWSP